MLAVLQMLGSIAGSLLLNFAQEIVGYVTGFSAIVVVLLVSLLFVALFLWENKKVGTGVEEDSKE